MSLKLITFDLDNTLWHTEPVIIKADEIQWQSILSHCPEVKDAFSKVRFEQLKKQVAADNPHLIHKLSLLRLECLFQLFLECGLTEDQSRAFSGRVFADFIQARNQVELFPHALDLLKALQARYQVIALSNGNANLTTIGLDHLFDAHFHAENVKQPKPHSDMFLAALDHAQVHAPQALHIGDHPEQDIAAAQQLGFKTIWANVLNQTWPKHMPRADHDINNLSDITSLLL